MKKIFSLLLVLCLVFCALSSMAEEAAQDGLKKLVDEPTTLTVFLAAHTVIGTQIETWNEALVFQELEKRTGVHLEFITPVQDQQNVQLQLLVASGELPDIIIGTNGYPGGGAAMVNDGLVIDLAEHLDKLPNFKAKLEATELRKKEVYTDTGKIPGFPTFYKDDQSGEVYVGLLLRKDLLDQVGMDIPVTYDDWYNVLKAFKEECGISKPLVPGPEMFCQNNMWSIGYGFRYVDYFGTGIPFYQIDGEVRYAPIDDTDAFLAYLQMMAKWYSEGLLDPDFQTVTDVMTQISTYSSLDCGACVTAYSLDAVLESIVQASKPDFDYICVPMPVLEEGQKLHMYANTTRMDLNNVMISTKCKDIDLALAYFDQLYTDEGSLLCNWGVEGISFYYDENGLPQWTDNVINNPEYNFTSMQHYYLAQGLVGEFERRASLVEEASRIKNEMYMAQADNSYRIPSSIMLNEDEQDTYNSVMDDLLTYVEEKCIHLITGAESFDVFPEMIQTIRDMDVEEAIQAYQSALDRYYAR